MQALRIEAEGLTTSFRYPHFLMGRQPTFRMPPPATIYGHICSAAGEFLDPSAIRFAYTFRFDGIGDDLELLHVATVGKGRWPDGGGYPRNLDVTTNPSPREVLLHPRLTLYLAAESDMLATLERAFREPRYAVTLGRSQDLMAYRSVEQVDLVEAEGTYLEATLLPWTYRLRLRDGIGVTMPRFIDPNDRSRVSWSPFVVLEDRVVSATVRTDTTRKGQVAGAGQSWWVDPFTPTYDHYNRGVVWHRFVGDDSGE